MSFDPDPYPVWKAAMIVTLLLTVPWAVVILLVIL